MTSDAPLPLDPARLLAADPFVRGLARHLVRDPARADDIAQEAWVAMLQTDSAPVSLRGWLATIVRRLAVRQRRRQRREDRKLGGAPVPEPVPSAAVIAAREEVRARVVRAVLALPAPYRDVVLLRFFEQLPPRAIARRLQLPVETVRTRLKRALAQLRSGLDATTDGGRGAWALLLVPFARPAGVGAASLAATWNLWSCVISMATKAKTALLLAAALLVVGATLWLQREPLAPGHGAAVAVAGDAAGVSTEANAAAPSAASGVGVAASPTADRAAVAVEPAPTRGDLIVHVAFAADQGGGRPAPDVLVEVEPRGRDPFATPRRASTGEDGVARFEGLPAGAFQVVLPVRKTEPQWLECEVAAGATAEVTAAIAATMTARGHVVDRDGRGVANAEVLVADWSGSDMWPLARTARDGSFVLTAIADACHIGARAAGYAAAELQEVTGGAGADVDLRIVLDTPGAGLEGTVFAPNGEPLADAVVVAGDDRQGLHQRSDGRTTMLPRPQTVHTDGAGNYRFAMLAPGRMALAVRAPDCAPQGLPIELRPDGGNRLDVHLQAGTRLCGTVVDGRGQPVAGVELEVGHWGELVHSRAVADVRGAFVLRELPNAEFEVRVDGGDRGLARATFRGAPGAELQWSAVLDAAGLVRGRLLDAQGLPVAAAMIEGRSANGGEWSETARAGDDGRFCFRSCPADAQLELQVRRRSSFPDLVWRGAPPPAGELELRLSTPEDFTIAGRVQLEDGTVPQNVQVVPSWTDGYCGSPVERADAATGSFRIGPYPRGTYDLTITVAGYPRVQVGPRACAGGVWDLGTVQIVRGGSVRLSLLWPGAGSLPRHWANVFTPAGLQVAQFEVEGGALCAGPLVPGDYRAQIGGDGVANMLVPFAIGAGVEARLDVPVHAGVPTVLGFALPASERGPLQVVVSDARGEAVLRTTGWCDNGAATVLAMFDPGEYRVVAERKGLRGEVAVTVVAPGPVRPQLRLQ